MQISLIEFVSLSFDAEELPQISDERKPRSRFDLIPQTYRVTLVVEYYGWLDIDLGISPGWMAANVHKVPGMKKLLYCDPNSFDFCFHT